MSNKIIYFNLIDKINNIDFTFDLTPEFFTEVRSWSKQFNLTQQQLVGNAYTAFKRKDYKKGMMILGFYLLRSQNWKLTKDDCNCFNYYMDRGQGYGYIRCLPSTTANSHQEAHDQILSWSDSDVKNYISMFETNSLTS